MVGTKWQWRLFTLTNFVLGLFCFKAYCIFGLDDLTIALIIAGVGAASQAGAGIWGANKAATSAEEQKAFNKEQQDKADRLARREAMAKAIGAEQNVLPRPTPEPPGAPDMMGPQILSGLGNVVGQLGSTYAAGLKVDPIGKLGKTGMLKGAGAQPKSMMNYDYFDPYPYA